MLFDRPVPMDTPAVEAAVDAPSVEAAADVPVDAGRDAPPDDVDPTCALGAVESCLAMPPGPCPDLSDGVERTVQLGSFVHSLSLSCAGRMTSIGPDAFLPLRVRETSDVVVSAVADTGDTAVIALYPAGTLRRGRGRARVQQRLLGHRRHRDLPGSVRSAGRLRGRHRHCHGHRDAGVCQPPPRAPPRLR
jgi:hypothetical protein